MMQFCSMFVWCPRMLFCIEHLHYSPAFLPLVDHAVLLDDRVYDLHVVLDFAMPSYYRPLDYRLVADLDVLADQRVRADLHLPLILGRFRALDVREHFDALFALD